MRIFTIALSALKEIFPYNLLLIVFSPFLLGLFIDYQLIESRDIVINLVWISIAILPFILLKKRWIYRIVVSIFFFFGLVEIVHWIILKGPFTLTSLLVISNTNLQEAVEFFGTKATAGLLVILPYTFLYAYSLRHVPVHSPKAPKRYIIAAVLLFSTLFIVESVVNKRFIRKATPPFVRVTLSFLTQKSLFTEVMQEYSPRNVEAKSNFENTKQTFVLILGESCNRKHMSLYGASRKTSPQLENRNDLIVYNNVVSPYSNTIQSVQTMFSNSNIERQVGIEKRIDLIDVFHAAGFKTYWLSNQSPLGVWDNMVTILAKKSDKYQFVNTTGNSSFEVTQTISFDSKLFEPFAIALNDKDDKKLIVLHLMGSHTAYGKRYPSEFNIFHGTNHKDRVIARYDNSMLYNDFIVDSLLNLVSTYFASEDDGLASVIYLSDHGENVYDELDRVGHDYSNQLPKANVEVPFLVWLSPAFRLHYSSKVTTILSNSSKPFLSDDLFHEVIDLNEIQCNEFDETRSVFSDQFNVLRKRILEDGKDYDQ